MDKKDNGIINIKLSATNDFSPSTDRALFEARIFLANAMGRALEMTGVEVVTMEMIALFGAAVPVLEALRKQNAIETIKAFDARWKRKEPPQ